MTIDEVRRERRVRIQNAIRMDKKPDRIPHKGNIYGWMYTRDEEPLGKVLRDYDLLERDLRKVCETYDFDCLDSVGFRNIPSVLDPMGNSIYHFSDETTDVSVTEFDFMMDDEYPELGADFFKYTWEKLMPRKFSIMKDEAKALEALRASAIELGVLMEKKERYLNILKNEYGMECSYDPAIPSPMFGFDMLFFMCRGIKNISVDMRRRPQAVKAACDAIDETFNAELFADESVGSNDALLFDYNPAMMSQTILNRKQFDLIYGNIVTKFFKHMVEHNKTGRFFVEGSFGRFLDYLQDIPKGHLAVEFEDDDPYMLREKLPNVCIVAGMPIPLLGKGSKDECIRWVRDIHEGLGQDGGLILSQNKMLQYRNDADPENLKAVCDFVKEYCI